MNYEKKFDKNLFLNTNKFCNNDINNFISLLRKIQ